jgi:hypothetical protein
LKLERWARSRRAVFGPSADSKSERCVRGSHLDQFRHRLRQDLRDAEPPPDLDQLRATDEDFLAPGDRRQGEQDGAGVVVDHQGGFGARQLAQEGFEVSLPSTAFAARQVVFEAGVSGGRDQSPDGVFAQRRSAEIRVQDDAGGVDDRLQRRRQARLEPPAGAVDDGVRRRYGDALCGGGAGSFHFKTKRLHGEIVAKSLTQRRPFALKQPIDGRQLAQTQRPGLQRLRSVRRMSTSIRARPPASRTARLRLSDRLICSHAQREAYSPTRMPWRSSTEGATGRPRSKRRWSSHTNGSEVPVVAMVRKAKKSQRGPIVGSEAFTRRMRPDHPTIARTTEAIIRLR